MSDEIDNRMEKIRLKNEELEKKHKEILEDKLTAEKQNATINSLNLNKEKYEHPYDKIDLDYDVKISAEEMVELSKNLNAKSISESSNNCFLFIFLLNRQMHQKNPCEISIRNL